MQSDYQTLYPDPSWKNTKLSEVQSAWYQRTITIPQNWAGRRIALDVEYLNSYAAVYVDGRKVGRDPLPGRPGGPLRGGPSGRHACPQPAGGGDAAQSRDGVVQRHQHRQTEEGQRRTPRPVRRRLADRRAGWGRGSRTFGSTPRSARARSRSRPGCKGWRPTGATSCEPGSAIRAARWRSSPARRSPRSDVKDGRAAFTASWKPPKLWDINTPENQYAAEVSLLDARGQAVDTATPVRFGFREFWIQGRDFYLNGTRLYLSLVPLDNAQVGAALATYAGGQGEPAAPQEFRHQLRLYAQLRLRARLAPELRGNPARGGRHGDAGGVVAAALQRLRLEDARRRPNQRLRAATRRSTCASRAATRRWCATR